MVPEAQVEQALEALRVAVGAVNRRDFDAAARVLDSESEWDWSRSIGPDRATYKGAREIVGFWRDFADGFESLHMEIEEAFDCGELLVTAMLSTMRGREGIEVQARNAWLIAYRDGKLRRLTMFQTKEEALEAARSQGSRG